MIWGRLSMTTWASWQHRIFVAHKVKYKKKFQCSVEEEKRCSMFDFSSVWISWEYYVVQDSFIQQKPITIRRYNNLSYFFPVHILCTISWQIVPTCNFWCFWIFWGCEEGFGFFHPHVWQSLATSKVPETLNITWVWESVGGTWANIIQHKNMWDGSLSI
jgi:hypothetical protein